MTLPSEAPAQPPLPLIKTVPSLRRLKTRAEDIMKWSLFLLRKSFIFDARSRDSNSFQETKPAIEISKTTAQGIYLSANKTFCEFSPLEVSCLF